MARATFSISVENTFSDPFAVKTDFDLSVYSASWVGTTLVLQRAVDAVSPTWRDVKSYTANAEESGNQVSGGCSYRVGCKTGNYGGTAVVGWIAGS